MLCVLLASASHFLSHVRLAGADSITSTYSMLWICLQVHQCRRFHRAAGSSVPRILSRSPLHWPLLLLLLPRILLTSCSLTLSAIYQGTFLYATLPTKLHRWLAGRPAVSEDQFRDPVSWELAWPTVYIYGICMYIHTCSCLPSSFLSHGQSHVHSGGHGARRRSSEAKSVPV